MSLGAAALVLAGCAAPGVPVIEETPAFIAPRSEPAAALNRLWWILLAMAVPVFVGTMALTWRALSRRARTVPMGEHGFVIVLGIVLPAIVLTVLAGMTIAWGAMTAAPPEEPDVVVEVVGHQFWWEVRYPRSGGVTANEIHIPVGEPVGLEVSAADVYHSFWVPQLHGKIDMVPGRVNRFWIQADEPGEYRGICTEYCGIQHARMQFVLVATSREDFDAWVARQAEPAADVDTLEGQVAEGQEIFGQLCAQCHAVRGHTTAGVPPAAAGQQRAEGLIGPDLTHLADRRTLAAAVLENNRGNLGGWILDPQALKPGARMPPTPVDGEELQALLSYLESLR
jgi:cytochrome c oxidase subunit II